LWERREAIVE
jgi:hypothetical protein